MAQNQFIKQDPDAGKLTDELDRFKRAIAEDNQAISRLLTSQSAYKDYVAKLQAELCDFAKRILIYQHKIEDFRRCLSKYEPQVLLDQIDSKYEQMPTLDQAMLFELINGSQHQQDLPNHMSPPAQPKAKGTHEEFNVRFNPGSIETEFGESSSDEQINPRHEPIKSQWFPPSFRNGIVQQTSRLNGFPKKDALFQKKSLNSAKQEQFFYSSLQKNSSYKLAEDPFKMNIVDLDDPASFEQRAKIDDQRERAEQEKRQLRGMEQRQKESQRVLLRKEQIMVGQFVHQYLVHRLRYNEDHQRFTIPKKQILSLYVNWCHANDRKVGIKRSSLIQMAITHELREAFPGIDVYSKNYRGLLFYKDSDYLSKNKKGPKLPELMVEYRSLYE